MLIALGCYKCFECPRFSVTEKRREYNMDGMDGNAQRGNDRKRN